MFKFLKLRHALLAVLAIPFFLSIQGCDDRDAVDVAATIGVVGGALTVGSYNNGYYYSCNGYYGCGYYNYRGYYYGRSYNNGYYNNDYYNRNYRGRYHRDGYHHISFNPAEDASQQQERQATEDLNNTASVAAHYGITMDAASTLKKALNDTVETQSIQPVYALGLSTSDLQSIATNGEVSETGLQNVSAKLGLTVEQTRAAVKQMMADAQQK